MLKRAAWIVGALAVVAAPVSLSAQRIGEGEYERCMRLARSDPSQGFEVALAWQEMGGGNAARHCAALSLAGLGQFTQAAERLEALAKTMKSASDAHRAAVLAQAGTAWFRAAEFERAHATQTAALKLSPHDPEILIDRAMTLAGAMNYWEAIDDLNLVVAADPENFAALVLRASAYRFVDALPLAREDAAAAYRLAPERPEVLLEYGIILRLTGDRDGARQRWLTLIRLHDGTPASDAARRNLELLDVKSN